MIITHVGYEYNVHQRRSKVQEDRRRRPIIQSEYICCAETYKLTRPSISQTNLVNHFQEQECILIIPSENRQQEGLCPIKTRRMRKKRTAHLLCCREMSLRHLRGERGQSEFSKCPFEYRRDTKLVSCILWLQQSIYIWLTLENQMTWMSHKFHSRIHRNASNLVLGSGHSGKRLPERKHA